MFNVTEKKKSTAIDLEIIRILEAMNKYEATTEEYSALVKQLDALTKIGKNNSDKVSAETLAAIAANIGGLLLVLNHENAHAITSKALGMILKVRL